MKKTIGLIFSGYGQQFITMGKDIYNQSRQVQDLFEQASMCLDINFVQLCFAGSDSEMSAIDKGYLAIVLMQISMYSQLAQAGLRPDFIAGYDIGQYSAAIASGSLSFADGLYLLNKYAKLLQAFFEQHPNFAVLQLSKDITQEKLEQLCQEFSTDTHKIFISSYNLDESFFVAGDAALIEELQIYCKKNEIRKVKLLHLGYGLHSSLVESVMTNLSPYLFKIDFKPLQFPVITNVDGVYVTSPDALESSLLRQISAPILWNEVMDGFVGCQVLICVGPGQQIMQWAQAKYPEKEIYNIENLIDLEGVIAMIKKDLQEDGLLDQHILPEQSIEFGACHLDDQVVQLPTDLTIADQINELPEDYDIDEDEENL